MDYHGTFTTSEGTYVSRRGGVATFGDRRFMLRATWGATKDAPANARRVIRRKIMLYVLLPWAHSWYYEKVSDDETP